MTTGTLKDASLKDAADAVVADLKQNVLTKTPGESWAFIQLQVAKLSESRRIVVTVRVCVC